MASSYQRLTDSQWQISSEFLTLGKNTKYSLRDILDGILYLVRTGCQWRNLPNDFPPYRSVFYHYRKWTLTGSFELINLALVKKDRVQAECKETPSLICIDSQSTKCGPMISENKGIDGGKKVNGRGRTVVVDSGGRILSVHIEAANVHDGQSGINLLSKKGSSFLGGIKKILYDGSYNGVFAQFVKDNYPDITPELSSKPPSMKGFVPLKTRWVSERTFGWLSFYRRLDKDHEKTTKSSESMILLAHISILFQRLTEKPAVSFDKKRFC